MPAALFLATLGVMLFRPPGLEFYSLDRVAFLIFVLVILLRALALRQSLRVAGGLMGPMLGLTALAAMSALSHPFEAKTWSVLAAKYFVPFVLFWAAGLVFKDERSVRWLERFSFVVLAYLSFTAIAFLVGIHELVFPPFILDETIGMHADRARGPFLQAVANGVTLNLLGLLAIAGYRGGRLRGIWALSLLASLPVAILATKTRGVWLAFGGSVTWLIFRSGDRKARRAFLVCAGLAAIALIAVIGLRDMGPALGDRLQDNSSIEFRMAAYRTGLGMFQERPLTGWGTNELQAALAARINGFRGESFAVHNTYLEVLIEHGVVGFALYVWLMLGLFRLCKPRFGEQDAIAALRSLWPLLLAVYLVNAAFVVMNYQFVNGLLFTFAGILAASPVSARQAGRDVDAA
ncbi:MAG: O-antigen ligase family protein [Terriglobales bacterium]